MGIEQDLQQRAEGKCELCAATDKLSVYEIPPAPEGTIDHSLLLCETCKAQIEQPDMMVSDHWRCLGDSMWTPIPAVQVMAWRQLNSLKAESWAQDLLDMLYLEPEILEWAQSGGAADSHSGVDNVIHMDSNGTILATGDTVTLIKDLPVKGGGFTAKRGTAVRNISLVPDNEEHIEGRVNGQQIVILTKFVKKSGAA